MVAWQSQCQICFVALTKLAATKTRTRHLSIRAAWLHHLVRYENVSMQYAPTNYQRADIFTKGLSASLHEAAKELHLQVCDGLPVHGPHPF